MMRPTLLVANAVGLRATQLLLRTVGFRRSIRLLGAIPMRFEGANGSRAEDWADAINDAARGPRPPSCLDRSVLLWLVMRLHGLEGVLRIGIATSDNGIDGHAWVEHEGILINDSPEVVEQFAVFDGEPIGVAFL